MGIEYIVDTNVPLVANGASDMSGDCVAACINFILAITQGKSVIVIDDGFHVLGENQHELNPKGQPGIGDLFLRWILTNLANSDRVKQVKITPRPPAEYDFEEFPASLENAGIDHSDKKFFALACANDNIAPIAQASDSKWVGWVDALAQEGIRIEFLCKQELEEIFHRKIG